MAKYIMNIQIEHYDYKCTKAIMDVCAKHWPFELSSFVIIDSVLRGMAQGRLGWPKELNAVTAKMNEDIFAANGRYCSVLITVWCTGRHMACVYGGKSKEAPR